MKEDERALLAALCGTVRPGGSHDVHTTDPLPYETAERLGVHWKRAEGFYRKWTRKGWWNYGVSARTGWFTDAGLAALDGGEVGE